MLHLTILHGKYIKFFDKFSIIKQVNSFRKYRCFKYLLHIPYFHSNRNSFCTLKSALFLAACKFRTNNCIDRILPIFIEGYIFSERILILFLYCPLSQLTHIFVRQGSGKRTKVPKSAAGGATCTTERWRKTWVTYDDAILAKERINADGIGFILPKGYFFLDIDGRSANDAFAKRLLKRFDTYAEYSVSGNGIHIYGKCDLSKIPTYTDKTGNLKLSKDFYQKNSGNGIELYFAGITRRFAAFTGNVISNMPLKDCSAKTLLTLNEDMRRSSKPVDAVYDDAEIFDIICELRKQKNFAKFIKLFDDGDYSDYGSHSEADAALCTMIAFRTEDEASLIDKIFRLSALYRDYTLSNNTKIQYSRAYGYDDTALLA